MKKDNTSIFVLPFKRIFVVCNPLLLQKFDSMQKQQAKGITMKHQLKKEKVINYPYHIVSTLHCTEQNHIFLFTVDYFSDATILVANPFLKDMTKLSTSNISLNEILPRRIVTTIYVKKLHFKPTSNGVSIISGEFVLGYASGQIAVIQYKDKDASIKARLNKNLKSEGFLSKTSSFFFGGEQTYSTYIKEPVKSFHENQNIPDLLYSYQVGNNIMFLNELNESNQYNFFNTYEANTRQNFMDQHDFNKTVERGSLQMFCTAEYYALRDNSRKIGIIRFQQQVTSYEFLNPTRREIAVSLSTKEMVLLISTVHYTVNTKIKIQMAIRRISTFQHKKDQYIAILVYSNYSLLFNLSKNKYLKFVGHRSFTAGIMYEPSEQLIISSGMDHRVSLIKLRQIKENSWNSASIGNDKSIKISDMQAPQLKFPQIFSVGQYNNVRSNLHSYGFAGIFKMGNLFCMPTYDARILFYKYG